VGDGYAFAYSTPKIVVPVGDPFLEPAAISDVTIMPIRLRTVGVQRHP